MSLVGDVQALTLAPFFTPFPPAMMPSLSLQLPHSERLVLSKLPLSAYICYLIYPSHLKLPEHSCVQYASTEPSGPYLRQIPLTRVIFPLH